MNRNSLNAAGRLLREYTKPYFRKLILAVLLGILASGVGGLTPFVIGKAITELSHNLIAMAENITGAGINFPYIKTIIATLLIIALTRQVSQYLASFLLTGAIQGSFRDLRSAVARKMNRLPVSYFDTHKQGTVLSCITNDVDTVSNALQQSLIPIVGAITSIVIYFVMMIIISPKLGTLSLLIIPAAFFISKFVMKRSQNAFMEMQNTVADLNGYIQERYSGFTLIKLYNHEDASVEEFAKINAKLNRTGFQASFTSALLAPLLELLINLFYAVMVLLTGLAVFSGMPLGSMQSFVQYIWQMYDPLGQATQLSPALQSAVASMARIANFLEENEEDQEQYKPAEIDLSNIQGNITFNHVAFSYRKERPLITDLSFDVKSGQTIAIVGATGAGKTTIINLLMRFYDIDSGNLLIDGENVYDMRRAQQRSLFGMVLQDTWLYHASILDNIRFGRLDASRFEVVEAAKTANVHHFIKTLPDGYDTVINEESSNISQGEKQLLTIARAILANPRILILDEATSSVDTRLEILIQKAMKKARKGRTSFVIAHRLSTIRDADLILVLEHGDIVEKGSHEQLLAQKGVYERLYNSQFAQE